MKYLYGIQPTGRIHIGNYLGGLKLAIDRKASVMVACWHSMTSGKWIEYSEMVETLEELGADVFIQYDDSIFKACEIQCITPVSDLMRMTQWKDKGEGNAGLLTYPCLMVADIILAEPDVVIVGGDQLQHMEFYRRTCKRLGIKKVAKTLLTETPRIMSIKDPTSKMSKSLGDAHCLYLGDHEANRRKVMKAPTTLDGLRNLMQIANGLDVPFSFTHAKEGKENIIHALESL